MWHRCCLLGDHLQLTTRPQKAVQQVQVAKDELERVQKDDQLMALMNLTEMYNDTEVALAILIALLYVTYQTLACDRGSIRCC